MSAIAPTYITRNTVSRLGALSIYQVGVAALFISLLSLAVIPRFDNDIWWHLFVGRRILDGSGVPTQDFLSFTARSHGWIDHEWLSEVGMYASFKVGGLQLVSILYGLVITGAFMILFAAMRSRGVNTGIAALLTVLSAVATFGAWGPRVQMLTMLFVAAFAFMLERHRVTGGVEWLVGLIAIMWLWSNLHGGFAVGFILILAYLVGGILDRLQSGVQWRLALTLQKPLALSFVASLAITFLNPNTYHQLTYPLRFVTPNAFTNVIQESQSPNFHLYQQLPFELLLIGLIVCGLLVRHRISWIDLLLAVALTHLALQETRNIALWCMVITPIIAVYLQETIRPLQERTLGNRSRATEAAAPLILLNWIILLLVCAGGVYAISKTDAPARVQAAQYRAFPARAVAYVDHHRMPGRVFNSYSYGGYLIWKTDAKYPVFIDSRADTVYSDDTLKDYLAIYSAGPKWKTLLKTYDIRWVFVENRAPIAAVLSQEPGWRVLFRGAQATIIQDQR